MGAAFNQATLEEQVGVCEGTIAPWDTPCPVIDECFEWFVSNAMKAGGMQAVYDNKLVHGGVIPWDLLVHCKHRRKTAVVELPNRSA